MDILVYGFIVVLVFGANAWHQHDLKVAALERQRRFKVAQEQRYQASQLADIDNMKGLDFEHYLCHLLVHHGFTATVTPASNDLGVDIIAHRDGQKYAIQAKRYRNGVSRRAVSDAVAGKQHYGCDRAMVITNSFFTEGAKKLARSTGCELIDRDLLEQWVRAYQQAITATVPASVAEEYDESLEVGLAAGMDIPTAMAISASEDVMSIENPGCNHIQASFEHVLGYIIVVELLVIFIAWMLY